jgi:hypothetical protein
MGCALSSSVQRALVGLSPHADGRVRGLVCVCVCGGGGNLHLMVTGTVTCSRIARTMAATLSGSSILRKKAGTHPQKPLPLSRWRPIHAHFTGPLRGHSAAARTPAHAPIVLPLAALGAAVAEIECAGRARAGWMRPIARWCGGAVPLRVYGVASASEGTLCLCVCACTLVCVGACVRREGGGRGGGDVQTCAEAVLGDACAWTATVDVDSIEVVQLAHSRGLGHLFHMAAANLQGSCKWKPGNESVTAYRCSSATCATTGRSVEWVESRLARFMSLTWMRTSSTSISVYSTTFRLIKRIINLGQSLTVQPSAIHMVAGRGQKRRASPEMRVGPLDRARCG